MLSLITRMTPAGPHPYELVASGVKATPRAGPGDPGGPSSSQSCSLYLSFCLCVGVSRAGSHLRAGCTWTPGRQGRESGVGPGQSWDRTLVTLSPASPHCPPSRWTPTLILRGILA